MATKIRIKLGELEVEYEGEHDFLEKDLLTLVSDLMALAPLVPSPPSNGSSSDAGEGPKNQGGSGTGTVSTYAAKLNAKSGTDLIIATLLQAARVDGKPSLKRKDLLDGMKSAKTHYKATYSNNLSQYLESLVKSKDLNEVATDEYAISNPKMTALETQLAQA